MTFLASDHNADLNFFAGTVYSTLDSWFEASLMDGRFKNSHVSFEGDQYSSVTWLGPDDPGQG